MGWNVYDWRRILFTDETKNELRAPDGRTSLEKRKWMSFSKVTICRSKPYVLGRHTYDACEELVPLLRLVFKARRYVLQILDDQIVSFVSFVGSDFLIMHDNAWLHAAEDVI